MRASRRSRASELRSATIAQLRPPMAARAKTMIGTHSRTAENYPLGRLFAQGDDRDRVPARIPTTSFHHDPDAVAQRRLGREMHGRKTLAVAFFGNLAPARLYQRELQPRTVIVTNPDDGIGCALRERRLKRRSLVGVEHPRPLHDRQP